MKGPVRTRLRAGFTLLELLVATGLTTLVVAMISHLVWTSLVGGRVLGSRYDLTSQLRLVEAGLRADLDRTAHGSLVADPARGALTLSLVRPASAPATTSTTAGRVRFEPVRYQILRDEADRPFLVREELDASGKVSGSRRLGGAACDAFQVSAIGADPSSPELVAVRLALRVPGLRDQAVREEIRFLHALAPGSS
jgi:hypothetical protein